MPDLPIIVTRDGYAWIHFGGKISGPYVADLTPDGQIRDGATNASDPQGIPLNPIGCLGGKVHEVENPYLPPDPAALTADPQD